MAHSRLHVQHNRKQRFPFLNPHGLYSSGESSLTIQTQGVFMSIEIRYIIHVFLANGTIPNYRFNASQTTSARFSFPDSVSLRHRGPSCRRPPQCARHGGDHHQPTVPQRMRAHVVAVVACARADHRTEPRHGQHGT